MKYPYTLKVLKDTLEKEKKDLATWQKYVAISKDDQLIRQANGNIPNSEYRINELEKAIELIEANSEQRSKQDET